VKSLLGLKDADLREIERGAVLSRIDWVIKESINLSFFLYLCLLLVLVTSTGGVLVLELSVAPVIVISLLYPLILGISLRAGHWPLWAAGEQFLCRVCQIELPALPVGERLLARSFAGTEQVWPRRGCLTLTNRALLFQRPRWFFLPPWRPVAILRIGLTDVVDVVVDDSAARRFSRWFTERPEEGVLRMQLSDKGHEFQTRATSAWKKKLDEAIARNHSEEPLSTPRDRLAIMVREMRILLVNGPNLNTLGQREPHLYGYDTLDEIVERVEKRAFELGAEIAAYQDNREGALIDFIQQNQTDADGLIVNAGGYSHTSIALRDAIAGSGLNAIEVHISNVYAREEFRHQSMLAGVCRGMITGLGWRGYLYALESLVELSKESRTK
jgi:3-dehydroquinate dehydratase-2